MKKRPRETGITREDVYNWLQEFQGQKKNTKKMRDFIEKKLRDNGHDPTLTVDTSGNDSLESETEILDLILLDIESYGN